MKGSALILGGTYSGKSTFAESLLSDEPGVSYVATSEMRSDDPEWVERLRIHRARRPSHWETVETIDLAAELRRDDATPVLVDCLGVWLMRLLDGGCWDQDLETLGRLENRLEEFLAALRAICGPVVSVGNEMGLGVVPTTSSGRLFTDRLGRLNMRVAVVVNRAWLCVAGIPVLVKGT